MGKCVNRKLHHFFSFLFFIFVGKRFNGIKIIISSTIICETLNEKRKKNNNLEHNSSSSSSSFFFSFEVQFSRFFKQIRTPIKQNNLFFVLSEI